MTEPYEDPNLDYHEISEEHAERTARRSDTDDTDEYDDKVMSLLRQAPEGDHGLGE